ncbi:GNVR domain-containing protein [Pseudoalteromonas sp. B5MOD-1]|uniref:GumC family protein n=1 Tax=Pseudoalteromonas TaxID=53246 RepID=UPI000783FC1C|nr:MULTISPECIES: GNVR domain-containing protein [Pseudoalteromonas]KZY43695.1 sugar transporter [Pseudoalteromonas shioyasakiensis]RZF87105.1 sugar transporter [Pseudoalteromonas sp. CO109Y]TMO33264.1 sugar transporter [Pseudoalteromonas sp. S4491]TMO41778.1 sugar transporter [Pseudoalteromonas sp. S4488]
MLVKEQIKRLIYLGLYALYTRIKLFIIPFCIVPIVVIALGLSAQKQYTNHATILIEESALLNPYLDDLSFSFQLSDRMAALRTLVISRKVLIAVAKETQLIAEDATPKQVEEIHQKLSKALSLSLIGDELVRINFIWHDQSQMKPVLEKVVEKFIERLLAPTKASLDTSEQFFFKQLDSLREELELSEEALADFKTKNRNTLPDVLHSNRQTFDSLLSEKQQKLIALSGAKAKLNALVSKVGQANPILGNLEEKIIRTESELSLLRTRYTDKHSKIIEKKRTLANLKSRQQALLESSEELNTTDLDQLWQMVNTLPSGDGKESSVLVSQLLALEEARNNLLQQEQEFAMLEEQVQLVSERLLVTSDVEKQLRKLERDYDVKQSLYKDMLSRYEMAKVTGKLVKYEGPDKVKTIERAYSPTQPINTSMLMTVIVGIVLGIFTGSASVFVAALCDSHLKDIKTIEKLTSAEVVTVLPIVNAETNFGNIEGDKS